MKIFTIGFTGKSAATFFSLIRGAGVKTVIDTRRNNKSQLAGFTKDPDFRFFLESIGNIKYRHELQYAPSSDLLGRYRKKQINWSQYESAYVNELKQRGIQRVENGSVDIPCYLCSEHTPDMCHRRLLVDYLYGSNCGYEIIHL